jgi:hypothetical protein
MRADDWIDGLLDCWIFVAAEMDGGELTLVAVVAMATVGAVCSAWRCHSHAASAMRTTQAVAILKIPTELFFCDDMVELSAGKLVASSGNSARLFAKLEV